MRIKILLAVLVIALMPLLGSRFVQAGGSSYVNYSNLRLSASKASGTANNSDTVTFTVNFFLYKCASSATRVLASGCDSEGGVAGEETCFAMPRAARVQTMHMRRYPSLVLGTHSPVLRYTPMRPAMPASQSNPA